MKAPYKYYQGKRARYDLPDTEWLNHQYWVLGKSSRDMAQEVGCIYTTILNWMSRLGVPWRNKDERARRHSNRMAGEGNPAYNGGTSRNYHHKLLRQTGRPKVCGWCGTAEKVQVHHIDHNTANGNLENLTYLCGYCNRIEADLWALVKAGRVSLEQLDNKLTITFFSRRQ